MLYDMLELVVLLSPRCSAFSDILSGQAEIQTKSVPGVPQQQAEVKIRTGIRSCVRLEADWEREESEETKTDSEVSGERGRESV